jgi:ribonuclease-3
MAVLWRLLTSWLGRQKPEQSDRQDFDVQKLRRVLGYSFRNSQLFRQALVHRSYLQVLNGPAHVSNERLEYLGDSVLNLVVTEYAFDRYAKAQEGDLTKIRARLVNRKSLVVYAHQLGLWDFMFVSTSAAQSVGRGSETILADAFEALVGAIYLDGGYLPAREFVRRQIFRALDQGTVSTDDENFKSRLLELSQAAGFGIPRYVVVEEEGPDHDRTFTIEVRVGTRVKGVGVGKNKKDAEQSAAEQALEGFTEPT